ncbi:MAG TPA: AmiS/UreI family transporter [Mycobacterium sp.]|nr:AmiS/UreI family transporter [Mycobacterium sp.]
MGNVGLLLVGVVLFVNGLSSLGVVPARSAAPLNIFVGAAQVVLPTLVLVQAGGDAAIINAAWPSYLFGFTYLWFGLLAIFDLEPQGFGWYSAFVAAIAALYAINSIGTDPVFAVIWATWALMWTLFFVLLGLGVTRVGRLDLGRFTGWFLVLLGIPTCTVSAIFLLNGIWSTSGLGGAVALGVLVGAALLSATLARVRAGGLPGTEAIEGDVVRAPAVATENRSSQPVA